MENTVIKKPVKSKNIFKIMSRHKVKTVIVIALVAGGAYYYKTKNVAATPTKYVLAAVTKGSIFTSVSGSGQISPDNQLDVKPKVLGDILQIKVKAGDKVKAGQVLAVLDSKDLVRKMRDAENALEVAKVNLNLKLAGLSKEDLAVASNTVAASKLSYEMAVKNVTTVEKDLIENLRQAETSVDNAQRAYDNAVAVKANNGSSDTESIAGAYNSTRTTLTSAMLTLRSAVVAADSLLLTGYYSSDISNYKQLLGVKDSQTLIVANDAFLKSKTDLEVLQKKFDAFGGNLSQDDVEAFLPEVLAAASNSKLMMRSVYNVLVNTITSANLSQSTLDGLRSSALSQETTLISTINNLQTAKQTIANVKLGVDSSNLSGGNSVANAKAALDNAVSSLAQTKLSNQKTLDAAKSDVESKQLSYDSAKAQFDLKVAPPREIDLATSRLQVVQAQETYRQAAEDVSGATIKATIDGQIAKVYKVVGDSAGTADPIVMIITTKSLATIALNEVDVAKVKLGQKVSLTVNAIDGLTMTGEVAEIDSVGTVTQGVVNYNVKISFDAQDERVKSQMSLTATIITNQKLDTLIVSSSAIQTDSSGLNYVLVPADKQTASDSSGVVLATYPISKYVEIGLVNDTDTEIVGGLAESDIIVINTISGSATTATTAKQTSGLNLLGGGGGMRQGGR